MTFFDTLPFNTSRAFVTATTYNGCLVYVPSQSRDQFTLDWTKDNLNRTLDRQACLRSGTGDRSPGL